MNALIVAMLGALVGLGLFLVRAGVRGRVLFVHSEGLGGQLAHHADRALLRLLLAFSAAVVAIAASHWPVLAAVAAASGWYAPSALRGRGAHGRELELVEAIASWTEQIRDTLAAANGLEHAIGATASLAPRALAAPVQRLAARIGYEGLPAALRRFAEEVDHPMADFVVVALVIAAEKEARDLGALLGHLAESARDEARMRTRVWVGRARGRSAVRIIVGVVAVFVVGLLLLDRSYLRPYDTAAGQLVLAVILATFGASFVLMSRMGRIAMPQRFVARRSLAKVAS